MALRQIYPTGNSNDITFVEYDGSNNPIYVCKGQPGLALTATGWQIKKITWSGSNPTNVQFANGSPAYNFIANSRGTYSYS